MHSASIPSFKTFFRYFVHHTRWYCREYTYPLPYESSLLLILNIFFSMFILYHMQEVFANICSARFLKKVRLTHHYYNIFMGNPLTSSKDLSISLLKLLECRMQWYIDFITWTSRPYFRLITGSSFTVFVLCRLNHIRCIRVTHSSLNR